MTPSIIELEKEECLRLRPLWEEVFLEDSKEFTDYYFRKKAGRNHAFAMQEDKDYTAMLYLSPYDMMLRAGEGLLCREVNYIIGVATKKEYRHRGYMDRLLKRALEYMYGKGQPFTFLMPANPKIYEPYEFTYIYDREQFEWKGGPDGGEKNLIQAEEDDFPGLAEYAAARLAETEDVFIKRDGEYYRVMEAELEAQQGAVYLLREEGGLGGYLLYTEEGGRGEIQEAVTGGTTGECPVVSTGKKTPAIMARAVDLGALLGLLRTKAGELELTAAVTDPLLTQNSGIWKCSIGEKAAGICRTENGRPECRCTIEKLTAWIFGYAAAEDCFSFPDGTGEGKEEVLHKMSRIQGFQRVFINEIV